PRFGRGRSRKARACSPYALKDHYLCQACWRSLMDSFRPKPFREVLPMTENETYDELSQYDQSYSPKKSGQRPGIDLLTDGDHDFRLLGAELRRTPKQQELILSME